MSPQPAPQIIKAPAVSDGDSNHRPTSDLVFPFDPEVILKTLAFKWMTHLQHAQPASQLRDGVGALAILPRAPLSRNTYTFDKLPSGYAVYGKSRIKGRVDKYIYGHPTHRVFSSTEQFFPHLLFLALYKDGDVCKCDLCETREKRRTSGDVRRVVHYSHKAPATEESLPESLLPLPVLHGGNIDWTLDELHNMDWRGENEIVHEVLHLVSRQPAFVPRVGELVLWCDQIDGEIRQDPSCGDFRIFDPTARAFTGYPQWMGGVVTQSPIVEQPIGFEDISKETGKEYVVTSSGFRIEWYAGPNATKENLSNRYSHVPMHHVRPLAFWKEYMCGIPNDNWHPTVKNCLEAMGTLSTIKRYRLKSYRSAANIYSKGCFLGAEALYTGDVIRLSLDGKSVVTDVLKIHTVVTRVESIETSESVLSGENFHHIYFECLGYAYTVDPRRSPYPRPINPVNLPPVMRGYGPWYHIGPSTDMVSIDHSQILGRLFEKQAMDLWSSMYRTSVLEMGGEGVLEAREYAAKKECRAKQGKGLYLADSRAESLNLGTFNGIDVGVLDPAPGLGLGKDVLAALDSIENEEEHHSPLVFGPKLAMVTGTPSEDSEKDQASGEISQEDGDGEKLGQGTAFSATAVWNKKRDRPVEGDDNNESSLDELQSPSLRKRGKSFMVQL